MFLLGFSFLVTIFFIFLASALTFANLRFEKIACDLDPAWCQESSVSQAKRALNVLFSKRAFENIFTSIFLITILKFRNDSSAYD